MKDRFEKFGVGHFYIRIEMDDGTVHTFSYHPDPWPEGDPLAPWYKLRVQADNLCDGNNARPARIWENDPADVNLTIDGIALARKMWEFEGDEEKLLTHIRQWISKTKVGYELGESTPDRLDPHNTVGVKAHRTNLGRLQYWVYGQNCGWWAMEMIMKGDFKVPTRVWNELRECNLGVGIFDRYADNAQILARLKAEKSEVMRDLARDVKKLLGMPTWESPWVFEVGPDYLYPIKIEPGPGGPKTK